jgi:hypothetical protein
MASRKSNPALDIIARAARTKASRKKTPKARNATKGRKANPTHDAAYYRRQIASFLDAYRNGEIDAETYVSNANHLNAKLARLSKKPAKKRAKKATKRRRR